MEMPVIAKKNHLIYGVMEIKRHSCSTQLMSMSEREACNDFHQGSQWYQTGPSSPMKRFPFSCSDSWMTDTIESHTRGLLLLAEMRINAPNDAEYRPQPQLLTD